MRTTGLKQVTIGLAIIVLLAVALLSVVRVRTADRDDPHGAHQHHHHGAASFMEKGKIA